MSPDTRPAFLQPPSQRGWPLGAWVALLVALGAAALYWLRGATPPRPSAAPPAVAPAPAPPAAVPAAAAPRAAPAVRQPPPSGYTQVTRCVAGGRTTFTDRAECPPGAQATRLLVQRDLNLADGARLPPARPSRTAPDTVRSPAAVPAADFRRAECAQLALAIERWDAQARQPQSAQTQDWIAAQRRAARDRQFALRC